MQGTLRQARAPGSSSSNTAAATRQRQPAAVRRTKAVHVAAAGGGGVDLAREKISLPQAPTESKGVTYKITMVAAGDDTRDFTCADNEYILNAAEASGLDLPATCRSGICGACVARRTSGTIDQSDIADLSFTLTDDEVEQGMTLLCMSRATSDCTFETQSDWGYSLGIAEWKGATGAFASKPDPLMGTSWTEEEEAKKKQS